MTTQHQGVKTSVEEINLIWLSPVSFKNNAMKSLSAVAKKVRGFRNVEIIRGFLLLTLVACLPFLSTFAQSTQLPTPMTDTLKLPPGTIHARVLIKDIQKHQATIEIIEVIAEGHGIVNVLSKGQILTIAIPEKGKMSKGKKTDAFLREKAGVDASQSSYALLRTKDL